MNRRDLLMTALAASFCAGRAAAETSGQLVVYKSPSCGCCKDWAAHMRAAGFEVTAHDVSQDRLWSLKAEAGVGDAESSCHTAFIDGYVIEGHVPAQDVRRLLEERPEAHGLSVPGMPIGSPGMEQGSTREAYDTLLLRRDGGTDIFAHHE